MGIAQGGGFGPQMGGGETISRKQQLREDFATHGPHLKEVLPN